ncbi:TasA family protein [Geoglobus acetivorans]|uniref:TasA family protein n=1 Tax=Geoglobus acetivorans TaxID=565033 RepID=UPI0011DE5505
MRWIVGVLMVALVGLVIGAGTFAYFSDTETSSGNQITAGTLELKLGDGANTWYDDPNIPSYTVTNVYPGWSDWLDFYAKNFGSIDGDLYMKVTYTESTGDNTEAEGSPDDAVLDDNLCVAVTLDGTSFDLSTYDTNSDGCVSLSEIANQYILLGDLTGGNSMHIKIDVNIPTTVGNEIQGDTVTVNVEFKLMQDGILPS